MLESLYYRNPEEVIDEIRARRKAEEAREKKQREHRRKHKARRIRALVKKVMKEGGSR